MSFPSVPFFHDGAAQAAAPTPRGRPSWSGLLRLSLVAEPVKAYTAVAGTPAVSFNQLHAGCGQRVRYEKHCPDHGLLDAAAIARGYEYVPGQYVVVEAEELDKLRPAKDKALVLEQFIAAHQIEPSFAAGRSYYLVPDGLAAHHAYGVLAEALRQDGKWGIGRVVLSGHRQLVQVRPHGWLLAMDVLYYPAQIRAASAWEAEVSPGSTSAAEVDLARQLIASVSTPLDWSKYRDTAAEDLAALVEAKVAGRPLTTAAEEPVAVMQLLDALKQSVAAAAAQHGDSQPVVTVKAKKSRSPRRTAG